MQKQPLKPGDILIVNHSADVPRGARGRLVPPGYSGVKVPPASEYSADYESPPPFTPKQVRRRNHRRSFARVVMVVCSFVVAGVFVGNSGFSLVRGDLSLAAPIVTVQSDSLESPEPLHYGASLALAQPDFFKDTRDEFVTQKFSFIEADLTAMQIRYYENGEKVFSAPILSKGKEGSWWETPAGLYEIGYKAETHFSSFGQVYQPWSMAFQGNFFIHGWPEYADGTPVPEGYSGGCIRLANDVAEELYGLVAAGTPVLVHEEDFSGDGFVYEVSLPDFSAPHYLLADVKNNSVLLSSELDAAVPIASITKLMTALIAAEYINLDNTVRVAPERYVTTSIPRLESRYTASMYSLLQLLLLESSNEAAEVIAAQLGRERFIQLMNEKAQALGLDQTSFADPSGLDDGNISSVGDLYRLVQYIYNNRSFILELTANQDLATAYTGGQFGTLENFNEIEDLDNFIGGKIGETTAAGQTSVSLHRYVVDGEERIIAAIILGSKARSEDVRKLLGYMESRFGAE